TATLRRARQAKPVTEQARCPQHRQQKTAQDPKERRPPREMPAGCVSEGRLCAIPDCAEGDERAGHRPVRGSRDNRAGRERRDAACPDFWDKVKSERVASKACPAQLPPPYLRSSPVTERLREWPIDDAHA